MVTNGVLFIERGFWTNLLLRGHLAVDQPALAHSRGFKNLDITGALGRGIEKLFFGKKNMRNKYLGFYCNFAGILLTCYSAWNLLTCYYSSEHKRQKNADQFSNMGCHTISLHETKSWSWRIGESANMDLRWCGSSTRFMAVDYLNLLFGIWPKIFPGMGSWLNRNSWSKKLGHF